GRAVALGPLTELGEDVVEVLVALQGGVQHLGGVGRQAAGLGVLRDRHGGLSSPTAGASSSSGSTGPIGAARPLTAARAGGPSGSPIGAAGLLILVLLLLAFQRFA